MSFCDLKTSLVLLFYLYQIIFYRFRYFKISMYLFIFAFWMQREIDFSHYCQYEKDTKQNNSNVDTAIHKEYE